MYTIAFTASSGSHANVFERSPNALPLVGAEGLEQIVGRPTGVTFRDFRSMAANHDLRRRWESVLAGYNRLWADWTKQVDGVIVVPRTRPATRAGS